ncbi:MAG TPA: hypothetical protein VK765_01580 [Solirubrobacteraceae bacterium]|jgi:hypothetical protein|nr:hypothetical protein [Solirubrobacteraceae bacterium]
MVGERSRYGLCVSAVGAIVLAASVFMPWYRVVRPHPLTLDGYRSLSGLSLVLLAIAALAMLDVLLPLVRGRGPVPVGAGGAVVLLGAVAGACALYRMVDPPAAVAQASAMGQALGFGEGLGVSSLREGAWLALIGSVTVMLGGLWPRFEAPGEPVPARSGTLSLN